MIKNLHRISIRPMFAKEDRLGWAATFIDEDGFRFGFSRFDDEEQWACDSLIGANGMPHWVHGEGDRTCLKQVATGACEDVLDAALWAETH